tara:strand:- start:387 stop:590 length:204 start_codon:yes stop_codon:yes gene_type:complete
MLTTQDLSVHYISPGDDHLSEVRVFLIRPRKKLLLKIIVPAKNLDDARNNSNPIIDSFIAVWNSKEN